MPPATGAELGRLPPYASAACLLAAVESRGEALVEGRVTITLAAAQ